MSWTISVAVAILALHMSTGEAADSEPQRIPLDEAAIAAKVPPATAADVTRIDEDLFQVRLDGGTLVYVTSNGRYLIAGDLFDADTKMNLSESLRLSIRKEQLKHVQETEAIVFEPVGKVRHTITVFTDVDCMYCRKFHSEIEQLSKLGIRIRYLAFPRSGPTSDSWVKADSVWCAADRQAALTRAKLGDVVPPATCNSPVSKHYELGKLIGVPGTPMILTENGQVAGGYLPPSMLIEKLDKLLRESDEPPMVSRLPHDTKVAGKLPPNLSAK
jgi:thiol:disulfide interchange protein DsbC